MKRFVLFPLALVLLIHALPASAADSVTVINRSNHCAIVKAEYTEMRTGPVTRGPSPMHVDRGVKFTIYHAMTPIKVTAVVQKTSRCDSGALTTLTYTTDVHNDRLKLVNMGGPQLVRD
jgi:hypothetical protein